MEVVEGKKEKVYSSFNINLKHDREEKCRCRELRIICKQFEDKHAAMLEEEIQKSRKENEALERKNKLLEVEKLTLEEELKVLRHKNWECGQEKKPALIDLTTIESEDDEIVQILIENKVLECEKKKAENDTEIWKARFKELESRFLNFEKTIGNGNYSRDQPLAIETGFSPGTPPSTTLLIDRVAFGREKKSDCFKSRVRRQLEFKEETSTSGNISMSTPGITQPIILGSGDGTDREVVEPNIHDMSCRKAVNEALSFEEDGKFEQENNGASDQNLPFLPKRKRASRVVKSDSDSDWEDDDDDDNILISKLRRMNLSDTDSDRVGSELNDRPNCATSRKHRLRKASTGKEVGFVVDCSDASSNSDKDPKSEHSSEEDFDEILSKIQRKKDKKLEWEFEADMLADFGKNPELCMKAVCALYRQQTSAEKICRSTIFANKQGFNQFDAFRGSVIAEFLTGGDANGDVVKSVDELQEHDAEAIEVCRQLATRYSKQLFKIYKEKVYPFFLPNPPSP